MTIQAPEETFQITPADVGLSLDSAASLEAAMNYGRDGSVWADSQARARALLRGADLPLRLNLDPKQAASALGAIAPKIDRAPADAHLAFPTGGAATIVAEEPGRSMDTLASLSAIARSASRLDTLPVAMAVQVLSPAIDAADLEPALAAAKIAISKPLVLAGAAGDQVWHLDPADLARFVTVADGGAALSVDRAGLAEVVKSLAASIDQPLENANVIVEDGVLIAIPFGKGVMVDVDATVDAISSALLGSGDRAELTFTTGHPQIETAIAEAATVRGEALLNAGMSMRWDGGAAMLDRTDLLRALTISVDPDKAEPFTFGLDEQAVTAVLGEIAAGFDQPMVDARFRLVDGQVSVAVPERVGRSLDVAAGAKRVMAAFGTATPVTLDVRVEQPAWTSKDSGMIALGGDILGEGGTYYGDSSDPRRHNVELAASLESGWLVAPGEQFSYAENVGPVEESTGFVTGFGITQQGDEFITSPVVGGGICQVSTTIFQSAFWAGLPFLERYQHPYFLANYSGPPTGLPGLDAMVNIEPGGSLDMRFRNTTDNWIAVIVIADGANIWSKIIGTDPGWDVEVAEPVVTNEVTPSDEMLYVDSPELPDGQEMVVEHASRGFDVAINRTVYQDGQVVDQYTVESSFTPSRNRTLRGTGEPQS